MRASAGSADTHFPPSSRGAAAPGVVRAAATTAYQATNAGGGAVAWVGGCGTTVAGGGQFRREVHDHRLISLAGFRRQVFLCVLLHEFRQNARPGPSAEGTRSAHRRSVGRSEEQT